MSAIVLLNADDPIEIEIIKDGEYPMVFDSVYAADTWIECNARCGWCTRIIDLDN